MANELRVTSRTPSVKIDAGFMLQAAGLPDAISGKLFRWGMDNYQDKTPLFTEWLELDQKVKDLIEPYLDRSELEARRLIVIAFKQSALKAKEVSASRAHARSQRNDLSEADREWPDPYGHIKQLNDIGMTNQVAVEHLRRWVVEYSSEEINVALGRIDGRRIDRPGPYLEKILKNGRKHLPSIMSDTKDGKGMAKVVRRRIQVAAGSRWEFVGWTSKGHPRDGGTPETRKQAWRTDTGTLNYMSAENPADNPTYEEDAGIYEAE